MGDEFSIPSRLEVVLSSTGLALIGESSHHSGRILLLREAVCVPRSEVEAKPESLDVDQGMVYQAYLSRRDELGDVGLQENLVQKHHKEVYKPLGI